MSNNSLVNKAKQITGGDFSIFLGQERVACTVAGPDGRPLDTPIPEGAAGAASLSRDPGLGSNYLAAFRPLIWPNTMTPPQRPDLHCHSVVSDGTCTPTELAERAHARGVDLWALTDHDEVGGVAEAATVAARLGVAFVSGVEVSITWREQTIHIG